MVDVWQTGPAGGYDIWDERQPDGNFRGRIKAEEDGSYEFQTMLPKPYTVPTTGPWAGTWRRSASTRGGRRTSISRSRRPATRRW